MNAHVTAVFDGSSEAAGAVLWAAHEALLRQVRLHLVSCYDPECRSSAGSGLPMTGGLSTAPADAEVLVREIACAAARAFPALTVLTEAIACTSPCFWVPVARA